MMHWTSSYKDPPYIFKTCSTGTSLHGDRSTPPPLTPGYPVRPYKRFFETPEVGIIGIFVLLKYENELELVTSDIGVFPKCFSLNSVTKNL